MKLKNKKTGETGYYLHTHRDYKTGVLKVAVLKDGVPFSEFKPYEPIYDYDSLAELNDEWEDYEEPEGWWFIDRAYEPHATNSTLRNLEADRQIGNYFSSKEEAEKAVEKLKAWKRLKDKGFKFNGVTPMEYFIRFTYDKPRQILDNQQCPEAAQQFNKDLDLLFSGEDD